MNAITVEDLIEDVIRREGGYVNHKADRGGPTNFGITLKTLSECRGEECTDKDVALLTKQEATSIYFKKYYVQPNISKLPVEIQPVVFDMAVNMGPSRAAKILQSALNISQDGKIGNGTIGLCQKICNLHGGGTKLVSSITEKRIEFYNKIVERNPSQIVFLKGWINRAREFI